MYLHHNPSLLVEYFVTSIFSCCLGPVDPVLNAVAHAQQV